MTGATVGEGAGEPGGPGAGRRRPRRGFTLVELMVVVTIMAVLAAVAAPSFRRAVDQARADVAVSNLRAVWAAQRFYWVANRAYAGSLSDLQAAGLIDASLVPGSSGDHGWYSYATDATGGATASLRYTAYSGDGFQIDAAGSVTGSVHSADGVVILPPALQ